MLPSLVLRLTFALFSTFALAACGDDDDEPSTMKDGGEDGGNTDVDAASNAADAGGKDHDTDAASNTPDGGDGGADDPGVPAVGQIGGDLEGEHAKDEFGSSVALSADGTRVIVGGPHNDDAAPSAGHARVFERKGDGWVQLGDDFDGEAEDDRFGGAVAISDDGTRIAIGSYLNDGGGSSSGHVRVFELVDGEWAQVGADIDGPKGKGGGWAVAMSASGQRVVVGAPGVSSVNGVVTVYEEEDGEWSAIGDPITGNNELGHAVTMSGDGNRIAVSAPSPSSSSGPGTTRVYDWNGSAWEQVGTVDGEALGDNSGIALSISGDGETLAIGAPGNLGLGVAGGGKKGGHVRVHQWGSGSWTQLGGDLDGEPGSDFGRAVALSADGTRLIAGAPSDSHARFFVLSDDDAWEERDKPDFGDTRRAGQSVAISADGNVAAIGSTYHNGAQGNATGLVRVFALDE